MYCQTLVVFYRGPKMNNFHQPQMSLQDPSNWAQIFPFFEPQFHYLTNFVEKDKFAMEIVSNL